MPRGRRIDRDGQLFADFADECFGGGLAGLAFAARRVPGVLAAREDPESRSSCRSRVPAGFVGAGG